MIQVFETHALLAIEGFSGRSETSCKLNACVTWVTTSPPASELPKSDFWQFPNNVKIVQNGKFHIFLDEKSAELP